MDTFSMNKVKLKDFSKMSMNLNNFNLKRIKEIRKGITIELN